LYSTLSYCECNFLVGLLIDEGEEVSSILEGDPLGLLLFVFRAIGYVGVINRILRRRILQKELWAIWLNPQ
jgi:hypothetical protein